MAKESKAGTPKEEKTAQNAAETTTATDATATKTAETPEPELNQEDAQAAEEKAKQERAEELLAMKAEIAEMEEDLQSREAAIKVMTDNGVDVAKFAAEMLQAVDRIKRELAVKRTEISLPEIQERVQRALPSDVRNLSLNIAVNNAKELLERVAALRNEAAVIEALAAEADNLGGNIAVEVNEEGIITLGVAATAKKATAARKASTTEGTTRKGGGGGGKRQPVSINGVVYDTYKAGCEANGLDTAGDSGRRVLDRHFVRMEDTADGVAVYVSK